MRKKFIALTLTVAMGLSMVACGEKTTDDTTSTDEAVVNTTSYVASDYVTLGQYEGLEIQLEDDYEATDEKIAAYIKSQIEDAGTYLKDETKTVVEADSYVNVDYTGIQDGEAFSGGTATDVTLDIAANGDISGTTYIDGFTAGLVGHSVGETVDCDVTFPENYGVDSLNGATVIFRFTINYIASPVDVDAMTDEQKAEALGYADYATAVSTLTENYKTSLASSYEYDLRVAVMDAIINGSTVSGLPDTLEARVTKTIEAYESQYALYGMDLDDILTQQGMTRDDFNSQVSEQVEANFEQELIFEAVALALGMEVSDEEFDEQINSLMSMSGYESAEAVYEAYAVTEGDGAEYLRRIMLCNKAIDHCVETAVVK